MQKDLDGQDKKEKLKKFRIGFLKPFLGESLIFAIVFVLSLFSASKVLTILEENNFQIPQFSLSQFLTSFLVIVVFILLVSSLPRIKRTKKFIYRFFFIIASLYGTVMVLSSFLPDKWVLIGTALIFLLWSYFQNVLFHNLLMILGIAGVTIPLGLSIDSKTMMIILAILSFYDFIAVYKTKHMVKMAKSMMEAGVITAFFIPLKIRFLLRKTKEIQTGKDFVILGGGDIAFPLLFALSTLKTSLFTAAIISLFSLLGLSLSYFVFILQKERRPMPALPPIALFAIIGYIIATLLTG